jgi:hypothetical protein
MRPYVKLFALEYFLEPVSHSLAADSSLFSRLATELNTGSDLAQILSSSTCVTIWASNLANLFGVDSFSGAYAAFTIALQHCQQELYSIHPLPFTLNLKGI